MAGLHRVTAVAVTRAGDTAGRRAPDAGIPRDGGMADLLTEAASPSPRFAVVVCEDIERSARTR